MYIRFSVFFSYAGTLVPNVCLQFQKYSIFCLFLRGIKVRSVLRVLAIFCCRKKWIKEYASNLPCNFFGYFRSEACGSEVRSKIAEFWPKTRRMTIAQEMLNDVNNDPDLLKRAITGDESWVYGYDVETKAQSS